MVKSLTGPFCTVTNSRVACLLLMEVMYIVSLDAIE